ncbi:hypothetical protein [Flavisphingomonas formosensis]|nr:hypothetical protein [Sphingomonas formosensis]
MARKIIEHLAFFIGAAALAAVIIVDILRSPGTWVTLNVLMQAWANR